MFNTHLLDQARDAYYNSGNPIMTDKEFDALEAKEIAKGGKVKIGSDARKNKKTLAFPMFTLEKIYTPAEILFFMERVSQFGDTSFIVEPKLDGMACQVEYKDGKLTSITTRGNGKIGMDISHLANFINITKKITQHDIDLNINGELIISKAIFAAIQARRRESGKNPYNTARNAVSGLCQLNVADLQELLQDGLIDFFYYETNTRQEYLDYQRQKAFFVDWFSPSQILTSYKLKPFKKNTWQLANLEDRYYSRKNIDEFRKMIDDQNFNLWIKDNKEICLFDHNESFSEQYDEITDINAPNYLDEDAGVKDNYKYDLDGLVIKADCHKIRQKIGNNGQVHGWQVAYKFREFDPRLAG